MRGTQLKLRHFAGAATLTGTLLFAALTFASLPAGAQTSVSAVTATVACPVLSIGNPNPGNTVLSGDYVISGEAYDPSASSGSGIASVQLFLGRRDAGGTFLGSTQPGIGSNPNAFSLTVSMPDIDTGSDFAAYAISSVTGQQTSVVFPIFVGNPTRNANGPTPTPVPTTETISSTCPHGTAGTAPAAPAAPSAPAASSSPAAAPPVAAGAVAGNGCPVLTLGNPSPGDTMMPGGLVISGGASLPGANPQPGVSRVDLFIGARDQGGTFLGSGTPGTGTAGPTSWSVEVTVPNLGRGSNFVAYAIGTNGQETSISFPVFVGAEPTRGPTAPTPTPVPQTQSVVSTCGH
jgi:hypothetical protein